MSREMDSSRRLLLLYTAKAACSYAPHSTPPQPQQLRRTCHLTSCNTRKQLAATNPQLYKPRALLFSQGRLGASEQRVALRSVPRGCNETRGNLANMTRKRVREAFFVVKGDTQTILYGGDLVSPMREPRAPLANGPLRYRCPTGAWTAIRERRHLAEGGMW